MSGLRGVAILGWRLLARGRASLSHGTLQLFKLFGNLFQLVGQLTSANALKGRVVGALERTFVTSGARPRESLGRVTS